ncbi:MAG: DUF1036 domain-containing protein [Alphaproteobacteria bacterium]|nr:DUF1036 domain-containing protein [Alphaproteobacteria bacterium]
MRCLWLALVLFCAATPARAALTLCNRTSFILYAATAAIKSPQSQTQGWTRIAPGECQAARSEELMAETYLVHARSSLAHSGPAKAWGGNFPLCVKDGNFHFQQNGALAVCKEEGAFALPFAPLDIKGKRSWTTTLDESPALASLTAAQLVGVKRLLKDNGFDVGSLDGAPNKKTGAALAAFRKQAKLPERAGNSELFAALEKEALKHNAAAGYAICNDGKAALQAALATMEGGASVARGWWAVPPGACARAITMPLGKGSYYLFARRKGGAAIVTGPDKFCIAPTAFESKERDNCPAHGAAEAGFAQTQTRALSGYVAHIGDKGLLPGGAAGSP